jgi:hypothetical protein
MRAWLDSQHDLLSVERLPAYAPELNPVDYLWANRKDVERATCPRPACPSSKKTRPGSAPTGLHPAAQPVSPGPETL